LSEWHRPDGHWVSDDPALIDVDAVHRWMSTQSYWANDRPREVTEKAIAGSLNLGLFTGDGSQVGFCRWVTDGATFAWLCDVCIDQGHRGEGLGIFLVTAATEHPAVSDLRLLLGTRDAHDLYRKFGFTPIARPERLMEIWPDQAPPVEARG
jgi:GNAT superfamily N-acetyltransferase